MPSDPAIGFVIYVKNAVRTVARAIESVLAQEGVAFELVVVDGASTDGTVEEIRRYEGRLAHFESGPDRGAYEAANRGWHAATAPLVWFVMADDWLEPGVGAAVQAAAAQHPEAGIISTGARIVDELPDGGFRTVLERRGRDNGFDPAIILDMPLSAARAWRRDLLISLGGFRGDFPHAHDRDLMMRAWLAGARGATVDRVCYTYRRHPGSNTLGGDARVVAAFLAEHVVMARDWLRTPGLDAGLRTRILRWRREQAVEGVLMALKERRIGRAAAALAAAPSTVPATVRRLAGIINAKAAAMRPRRPPGAL